MTSSRIAARPVWTRVALVGCVLAPLVAALVAAAIALVASLRFVVSQPESGGGAGLYILFAGIVGALLGLAVGSGAALLAIVFQLPRVARVNARRHSVLVAIGAALGAFSVSTLLVAPFLQLPTLPLGLLCATVAAGGFGILATPREKARVSK